MKKFREIPSHIDHELRNWARWCWSGPWPHPLPPDHCCSIEHVFQNTSDEYISEEEVIEKPVPVNLRNAMIVQAVYEALPWLPQQVLRAEYPARRELKHPIHVSRDEYHAALSVAVYRVMLALESGCN